MNVTQRQNEQIYRECDDEGFCFPFGDSFSVSRGLYAFLFLVAQTWLVFAIFEMNAINF